MAKYREATKDDIGTMVEVSDTGQYRSDRSMRKLEHVFSKPNAAGNYLVWNEHETHTFHATYARVALPLSYAELHVASGLKVGDWVKITRKAESHEQGWDAIWNDHMDQYVGCVAQISIDLGGHYGFKINGAGEWSYPCFILEKVTSRPATEADVGEQVMHGSVPSILEEVFEPIAGEDLRTRAVIYNASGRLFALLQDLTVDLQPAQPICDHQVCELAKPTGVTCPPDSCDIDDGVRELPAPEPKAKPSPKVGDTVKILVDTSLGGMKGCLGRTMEVSKIGRWPSPEDYCGSYVQGHVFTDQPDKAFKISDVEVIEEAQANG